MIEIWKEIPEAPDYEVSNLGKVVSTKYKSKRILKPTKKNSGYLEVGLCCEKNKRKWYLLHRLVLSTFNPVEGMENMEVNHKDENKMNNCLDNLEWMTSKENCNYGTRNKKIKKKHSIKVMCVETGVVYDNAKIASELTGANRTSISNCLNGKRNKAGGYHWKEVE